MPESQKKSDNLIIGIVENTIETCRMLNPGDSILVGVSGGPDSVALLSILFDFVSPLHLSRIGVAHLNHSLRGDQSDRDAAFVEDLSHRFGLPCHTAKKDVIQHQRLHKISLEEAARQVRYGFYHDIAQQYGYNKIALGHHADDNAELILMYLLRGSGNCGLSGIPPVRDNHIIRPLIRLTRSDIMNYLTRKNLAYVTDASNEDIRFMRNSIRHRLIPMLKTEYNPKISQALNRLGSIASCENEWMDHIIRPLYHQALISSVPGRVVFSAFQLKKIHLAALRRILRKAINDLKGSLRRISYTHIDEAVSLLINGPASGSIDLPDRIRITKAPEQLIIIRETGGLRQIKARTVPDYEYSIPGPGTVTIQETGATFRLCPVSLRDIPDGCVSGHQVAFFDMNMIKFPLVIRNFRPGDYFTPLGMTGSQKVKKFFINHKVSRPGRAKCPLLLNRNKIIWIAGYRTDESAKITPHTKDVLKIEFSVAL